MNVQLDVGKVVGAASAPVALIIATSIFLSNLGGKYAFLGGIYRQISDEYRNAADKSGSRAESLHGQMQVYARRLRILMSATLWLTVSIECFILTVLLTGIGVIFPKVQFWTWCTVLFSFAGLVLLGAAVVVEMYENHLALKALMIIAGENSPVPVNLDGAASSE